MRKNLEGKTLLMFAVIALSLILLQAGSVSSADETIIYKGHTIRDDGSGTFEVAGKGGFNYSKFTHNAWDPVYLNMSNYVGTEIKATLSTDAYVGSLEIFNTTSGTWNITNVSIFYNGSLTTRGFTFNFLNAENRQFRILISNALKDDGTYSWFLNVSILNTMYVLEFDPIANGVNVFAQSKGGVATMQTPCCLGAGPITNVNDENYANNMQTGENNQNRITVVIQVSPPMAVNKSNIISPTTNYEPTDYNISGSGDNVTWALLKSVVGGPNSANVTDDFVNNQSYNYYKLDVTKWNGGVINDINGWAINEWLGYNTTNITPAAATNPPTVNVSVANSTSANTTASLASEQLFSNVNYSDANSHQEVNSTFKWFINNTNQSWGGGNKTAEMVPMIYKDAVGYWHLDENGGTNGYADSSGNGNTGTPFGGVVNTTGVIKGAANFDGVDDFVDAGNGASLNFVSENFTIAAWIKTTDTSGTIVERGLSQTDGYSLMFDPFVHLLLHQSGTYTYCRSQHAVANSNSWEHWVAVREGTNIRIYRNGIEDVPYTGGGCTTIANPVTSTRALTIGKGNTWGIASGTIDEVAVYNRSLTASEIKQLYLRTWYDYSPQLFLLHPNNETGWNTSDQEAPTTSSGVVFQPGRFVEDLSLTGNYANTTLYLRMDEGAGQNVSDMSGYGNPGVLGFDGNSDSTDPTWVNDSVGGVALLFDGINDRVNISHSATMNISGNFTLEAWVKHKPLGQTFGTILSKENSLTRNLWLTVWDSIPTAGCNAYSLMFRMEIGTANKQVCGANTALNDNAWHHVATTYNGTRLSLYLDGTLINSSAVTGVPDTVNSNFIIGTSGSISGRAFNGTIDEVRIINRSLTAAEVLADYRKGAKGVMFLRKAGDPALFLNFSAIGNANPEEGTVEFWMKPEWDSTYPRDPNSPAVFFGIWNGTRVDRYNMIFEPTTDVFRMERVVGSASQSLDSAAQTFFAGQWIHLATTWDNRTGASLYVNGVRTTNSDTRFFSGLTDLFIGNVGNNFHYTCNCTIFEFRISRKALTAQEINLSFGKGRAYFQNEYLLNSSNFAAGDTLKLEYSPKDSAGTAGTARNSSNLNVHAQKTADEAEGDTAIELGINSSIPTATKYKEQQAYVRNLSNNQTLGKFDWVAAFGGQRWLLNYITTGESYVRAPNLTTAVYVLEITDMTSTAITDEVSRFINATKS